MDEHDSISRHVLDSTILLASGSFRASLTSLSSVVVVAVAAVASEVGVNGLP